MPKGYHWRSGQYLVHVKVGGSAVYIGRFNDIAQADIFSNYFRELKELFKQESRERFGFTRGTREQRQKFIRENLIYFSLIMGTRKQDKDLPEDFIPTKYKPEDLKTPEEYYGEKLELLDEMEKNGEL